MNEDDFLEIKPFNKHYVVLFIVLNILGIASLIYFSYNANSVLGISKYSKSFFDSILINTVRFAPSIVFFVIAYFFCLPSMVVKWRIDKKFIQEISNLGGVTTIESCDMHKVEDVKLVSFGLFSNITVYTRDKSSPIVKIKYVKNSQAKEVFDFINEMAVNTVTEKLNRK